MKDMKTKEINLGGDPFIPISAEVLEGTAGVMDITIGQVRFNDLHFDAAETLRDQLTKALEEVLKQ
jgi:hypothetical protein